MAFKIGDKVIITTAEKRSEHGTICEILRGQTSSTEVYEVVLKNGDTQWVRQGQIFPEIPEEEYSFEVDIPPEGNIVIVKMMADGKEIARSHGHIIHGGKLGFAQAMSYACKRIYNDFFEEESERY